MRTIKISGVAQKDFKYYEAEISLNRIKRVCNECAENCDINDELINYGKLDCSKLIDKFYKEIILK